jgi:hypothetical protein
MGMDKRLVYVRHTEEINDKLDLDYISELVDNAPCVDNHWHCTENIEKLKPIFIFFCGKIYICYEFTIRKLNKEPCSPYDIKVDSFLHTYKQVEYAFGRYKIKWHKQGKKWFKWQTMRHKEDFSEKNVQTAFDTYSGKTPTNLNIKYKAPVLIGYEMDNKPKLFKNPRLADYKFLKRLDPYTIFQEIEMYVGGVLGLGSPNMIEVSDDVKRSQHGFDKWSFKRMPGKPKPRKNK